MTIRNLDFLFKPKSVAVLGASRKAQSVGQVVAGNLMTAGFDGPIMPVHPSERSIRSTLCYNRLDDLPVTPDLAVICTPRDTVPEQIEALGRRGTKAAVVISGGFGDAAGPAGQPLLQACLDAARPHLLRLIGPNCIGMVVPHLGLNASFLHVHPLPGDIAFVSQSGAMAAAVVDWATARGIGFSHVVSLGDMGDVDFGDMLDYLASDPRTRAILLYVQNINDARKFMSAGRAAARSKPVIVLKSGRSEAAAKAAASHTGALAGSDAVYDAAFRRAGMLRVYGMGELFDAVETLASGLKVRGERLAVVTNGGGVGVMATESLTDAGGTVPALSEETRTALGDLLPATWSKSNPIDILGDAPGSRYAKVIGHLVNDRSFDAVLVLNCPTAISDSIEAGRAVADAVEAVPARRRTPVLTCWLGEGAAVQARRLFAAKRIPTYATPGQAARAFMHLVRYKRNQDMLMETPPSVMDESEPDLAAARATIDQALDQGRTILTEPEAKDLLTAFGIPVVQTRTAATVDQAVREAEAIGFPVAIKIVSPDISHKSDYGGVRLNLRTAEAVREAAQRMLDTIPGLAPQARLEGFSVQRMASLEGSTELILGCSEDPLFGPTILFGRGGVDVELIRDSAVGLPPLNMVLAKEMMARTRVWTLLQGYRHRPAADLDAIAITLIKLSQMVIDLPQVQELDINPLVANDREVLALDARVKVRRVEEPLRRRTAIRAYPKLLERPVTLKDGREFQLRPVLPEDEPMLQDMIARSDPEDVRRRFFTPLRTLTHEAAARMTQIDYDRDMALVAEGPNDDPDPAAPRRTIYGLVRIAADPDNEEAEYGVMVRSDMKGQGLGYQLMAEILRYAQNRGTRRIYGEVLRENTNMLRMCQDLGFKRKVDPDEPGVMKVSLDLSTLGGRAVAE